MKVIQLIVVSCLVGLVVGLNTSSDLIAANCASSPAFSLKKCNISCITCTTQSSLACATCYGDLILQDDVCVTNATGTYFVNSYLDNEIANTTQVAFFKFADTQEPLDINNIVQLCSLNTYRFDMVGFFTADTSLSIQFAYEETMESVNVRFRVLSLLNNIIVKVLVNNVEYANVNINSLSNVSYTYVQGTNSPATNSYINIPSLSVSSLQTIMQEISTGIVNITTNSVNIQWQVFIPGNSIPPFWAMTDFLIIAKECSTCVKKQLASTAKTLAILIGVSAGVVIFLAFLLFFFIKVDEYNRSKKFSIANVDEGSSYLPMKSIKKITSYQDSHDIDEMKNKNKAKRKSNKNIQGKDQATKNNAEKEKEKKGAFSKKSQMKEISEMKEE